MEVGDADGLGDFVAADGPDDGDGGVERDAVAGADDDRVRPAVGRPHHRAQHRAGRAGDAGGLAGVERLHERLDLGLAHAVDEQDLLRVRRAGRTFATPMVGTEQSSPT